MKAINLTIVLFFIYLIAGAQGNHALTPAIESSACPVPVDSSYKTQCGYLIVPENRRKAASRMIKLPFVIVKTNNPEKRKDPVLYTTGGPGGSSLGWATGMSQNHNVVLQERDCIALEQRGTRFALPYLRSYELDTAMKEAYRKNLDKDSMTLVGLKKYKKTLVARGIDLSGYNSDESAADIVDLLIALHIDSVNLFGGSYSGGLMMAVLQKDPARVRTMVLDSPLPMFVAIDEDEPAHFNEAIAVLSERCATDSSDQVRYGRLKEKFQAYFTSLIGKTFYFSYLEKGANDSIRVAYTKNDLLEVIEEDILDNSRLKDVPAVITDIIGGNHAPFIKKRLDDIFNKNTAPDGMRISVYCADQAAYHSEEMIRQVWKLYPWMAGYHINDVYKAMCDCWAVPPLIAAIKQPFYSATPALLADGAMDPACAPLYIDMIHHYLPNSYRFLFLNRSHGVGGPTLNDLKRQFLDNPHERPVLHDSTVIAY
jgi:pimeloyl-ACP methyl ester carboxylesterase